MAFALRAPFAARFAAAPLQRRSARRTPAVRAARVSASAEEGQAAESSDASVEEEVNVPTTPMPGFDQEGATKASAPKAVSGPSPFQLMGFNGRPETINGRAAMLAFVAAVGAEASGRQHPGVLDQFHSVGGFASFLLVTAVVTIATFMPEIRKAVGSEYVDAISEINYSSDPNSKELGPFTAQAEMMNGRAAMLGLVALMATEGLITHSALF